MTVVGSLQPVVSVVLAADLNRPTNKDEAAMAGLELLGKRIFEDTSLSEPRGMACSSCHDPAKAFQGNNGSRLPALAQGSRPGVLGTRNTPTLLYAVYSPAFHFAEEKNEEGKIEQTPTGGQFLDGRAADLIAQVEGPLLNVREMNAVSKAQVVAKVEHGPYVALARQVLGEGVFVEPDAFRELATAVAAFESSHRFTPFSSKFDAYLQGKTNLTPQEARGFAVFKDTQKGNCISCHAGKQDSHRPEDWLFTDFTYDNLGVPRNRALPDNANPTHFDLGLCEQPGIEKLLPKGVDRDSLCGAFKVPTLRNVAVTAPYMHNGFFDNLRDAVRFYATRDTNPELWFPKKPDGSVAKFDDLPERYRGNVNTKEIPYDRKQGEGPHLTDADVDDLVVFLKTLTDETVRTQPK